MLAFRNYNKLSLFTHVAAVSLNNGQGDLDLFLNTAQISIVSLDRGQAEIARAAFARYGKGRHRASLNLGDCFSYARAQWL